MQKCLIMPRMPGTHAHLVKKHVNERTQGERDRERREGEVGEEREGERRGNVPVHQTCRRVCAVKCALHVSQGMSRSGVKAQASKGEGGKTGAGQQGSCLGKADIYSMVLFTPCVVCLMAVRDTGRWEGSAQNAVCPPCSSCLSVWPCLSERLGTGS